MNQKPSPRKHSFNLVVLFHKVNCQIIPLKGSSMISAICLFMLESNFSLWKDERRKRLSKEWPYSKS